MGNLDMIQILYTDKLDKTLRRYVDNALESCDKAGELIKQFQTLSTGAVHLKKSVDVYDIADQVFRILRSTTDRLIRKKIDIKPKEYYVAADPSQLHQVFLNLGINAIDAIEEKGTRLGDYIEISANEYNPVTDKSKTGLPEGEFIHIFFKDTGKGMSDEIKKKAFDPFFTTKNRYTKKGQGLGLAMVYNIITRIYDGYIDIESKEGEVTTFHMYLPRSRPEKEEIKEVLRVEGGNETILLIEDEKIICDLAENVLTDYGYNVLIANNGKEGLDKYTANKDSIDLVLLDLTMPEMSGQMVFREILKINPDVKIIISSGHKEEDTRKGILLKAKGYVHKPYRTTELAQTIRTVLDF